MICIGAINIASQFPGGTNYHFGRYSKFISNGKADVKLNIHNGQLPDLVGAHQVFDNGVGVRIYLYGDKKVIWIGSEQLGPVQIGLFSENFLAGDIFNRIKTFSPDGSNFPLEGLMGEFFVINLLGTGLGLCVHACGVIDNGKGMIFAGFGDAGKSTTAELWKGTPGVRVINDDRIIIRKMNGRFRMYGTPWHGIGGDALPLSAPLEKVFILKQSSSNQVKGLNPVEGASQLLARSFPPYWDKAGMDYSLGLLSELCQSVPCYELGFVPDTSVVEYVRCLS